MRFVLIIAALLCAHGITAYAEIQQDVVERDTIGGTGGGGGDLSSTDIDTFAELDAIVADEGLVNLNDAQTLLNKVIDGNSNTVKMLRHATDCTTYTGAVDGQYCWEQDTDTLYVCETADECDTAGEWDAVAAVADLTVEESDDNPTVSSVSVIQFNAAHFTVADETGGQVQVNSILSPLATALAADPAACSAGQFATDIAANGTLSCSAPDINGSAVAFDDTDGNYTATNVSAAIEELDNVNGSGPNASDAKVDWSQLGNVPAFRKSLFQLRPQSNEPPAASFATMNTRNSHPALRFNGNVCAIWSFVMPNWYGGNGVTVDIFHVSTETTNDVDWDVSMELVGTSQDIDSDSFATAVSGDNNANNATSGIPTKTSVALTSGAEMDSCVADALCRVRVCRDDTGDTGGADTIDYIGGQLKETP